MEQRTWSHTEAPSGKPSAASARNGCKCGECNRLLREYVEEYKRNKVQTHANPDGTAFYHTHKGQPSKRTARVWGCAHPRCLYLANLYLDEEDGVVKERGTNAVAADFGVPKAPATA